MKSPDDIKNGLESCHDEMCHLCKYKPNKNCMTDCMRDALAYIEQIETSLAQVQRERNAAVNDLHVLFSEDGHTCMICNVKKTEVGCMFDCEHQRKWRGVCEENTKEE